MSSSLTAQNRQALYDQFMVKQSKLRWVLSLVGGVVALLLLGWLIVGVLSSTTLSTNLKNREVAAETTLGDVTCRKTFTTAFPFFSLRCQDAAKNPVSRGSSTPK